MLSYHASCATGAAFEWLQRNDMTFARRSLPIRYASLEGWVIMAAILSQNRYSLYRCPDCQRFGARQQLALAQDARHATGYAPMQLFIDLMKLVWTRA